MDYVGFLKVLREKQMVLFTFVDVSTLFPETGRKTIRNNLTNWLSKGYIARLKRGVYECVQIGKEHHLPGYYVANKLYQPSYVSLETALSFYGLIPGEAAEVLSITPKPTRTMKNKYGVFTYRTCKKSAFFGYRIMKMNGFKVLIADREKALVDFIHYKLYDGERNFTEERFNLKMISKLDSGKIGFYAKKFSNKTFRTIKKCFL